MRIKPRCDLVSVSVLQPLEKNPSLGRKPKSEQQDINANQTAKSSISLDGEWLRAECRETNASTNILETMKANANGDDANDEMVTTKTIVQSVGVLSQQHVLLYDYFILASMEKNPWWPARSSWLYK